MLTRLYINNFITIESIEIKFPSGFITITGETGSGKSVILDALHLLCGNRLDSSKLNKNDKKIVIEGEFNISNFNLLDFFNLNDIDYSESTIIRREVLSNGKSRSFINDSPVKLELLKIITNKLIDIHSQHESLLLNNEFFQLDFIDNIIINEDNNFSILLEDYRKEFMKNQILSDELEELLIRNKLKKDEYASVLLSLNEFSNLDLKQDEKNGLLEEYNFLKNSSQIKFELEKSIKSLGNNEQSIINQLNIIFSSLKKINNYGNKITEFSARINDNLVDLQDVLREIDIFYEKIDVDQNRLSFIEERLNTINFLEEKYLVSNFDELIQKRDSFLQKKQAFSNMEGDIEDLRIKYNNHSEKLFTQAQLLSKKRKEAALKIELTLITDLQLLGIQSANLQFKFHMLEKYNYYGLDTVDFLFSANKGQELKAVRRIASGGELSRLMLVIKKHLFGSNNFLTIIFDEIDSGVSGEIAQKVGLMMKQISKKQQIMTITHLPQVASIADCHYKVFKEENSINSITKISQLDKQNRVLEIAKLLSGKTILNEAIANAKKMLEK